MIDPSGLNPPRPIAPAGLDPATQTEILRVLRGQGHAQMVPGATPLDTSALGYAPDVVAALRGTSLNPSGSPAAATQLPVPWTLAAPSQAPAQGAAVEPPDPFESLRRALMSKEERLGLAANLPRRRSFGGAGEAGGGGAGAGAGGPGPGAGPGSEAGGW